MRQRASAASDRGETLIELVVAVAILGIAAVAILAGVLTSIRASTIQRNEATGGAYVRSFAEAIQTSVDGSGLAPCGSAATTYGGVAVPDLPADYQKTVSDVQSWDGAGWGACSMSGIQRVKLTVTTSGDAGHRAAETLVVVVRQPCVGDGADPCA